MRLLSVDPGIGGALTLKDTERKTFEIKDVPVIKSKKRAEVNVAALGEWVYLMRPDKAIIELVNTMPGQGVATQGQFMRTTGMIIGTIGGMGVPWEEVHPAKWKRPLGLIGRDKEASRALAIKLYPSLATHLARKKDVDRAESVLIGHWFIHHSNAFH